MDELGKPMSLETMEYTVYYDFTVSKGEGEWEGMQGAIDITVNGAEEGFDVDDLRTNSDLISKIAFDMNAQTGYDIFDVKITDIDQLH